MRLLLWQNRGNRREEGKKKKIDSCLFLDHSVDGNVFCPFASFPRGWMFKLWFLIRVFHRIMS